MTRPQIYLTKDKKIRVGEKSPDGYVPADLAQSLADALEGMVNHVAILPTDMDQPGSVIAQARAALANYRKGE